MMHADPPVHTRYRRLVQPAFKPSVVRALEPIVRARTAALVRRIESGVPTDVVSVLSVPLPLQVISEILGVPDDEWERCYEWSEAVIPGATDWPEERRNQLMTEMIEYLVGAAKDRRARPRDDVLTQLAQVDLDGERLSDDESAMFLVQLLVAGNETTRDLISSGLLAFADHPGQWERLVPTRPWSRRRWRRCCGGRRRWCRSCGPPPAPRASGGVAVAEGEPVLMLFASANRDEDAFGAGAGRLRRRSRPQPPSGLRPGEPLLSGRGPGPPRGQGRARGAAWAASPGSSGSGPSSAAPRRSSTASGGPSCASWRPDRAPHPGRGDANPTR